MEDSRSCNLCARLIAVHERAHSERRKGKEEGTGRERKRAARAGEHQGGGRCV